VNRRRALIAIIFLLCVATTRPWHPHAWLDEILRATVTDGRVDYVAIRDQHADRLKQYIEMTGREGIDDYPRDQQLATLIDLYNAVVLDAIAARYKPGYSPSDDDFALFKEKIVPLKQKMISLNELENEIIRPTFKDPRVHAALVCGAVSCPPLRSQAYTRDNVQDLLEENMKRFINDPQRNVIDEQAKTLKLSKIFDWYSADFGGEDGVRRTISRYSGKDVSGYKLEFLEYDWTLNDRAAGAEHRE
jgi:hypothetical protein